MLFMLAFLLKTIHGRVTSTAKTETLGQGLGQRSGVGGSSVQEP